jgi:glycosyltransferase involved in cell wall biosynthesis
MRILISITNLMVGGAQTFVLRLASGLAQNHQVYVYNYGFPDPPSDTVINKSFPLGIQIIQFKLPKPVVRFLKSADHWLLRAGVRFSLFDFLKKVHFAWILIYKRIDVVNSHLFHSDAFTTSCCPSLGVPVVITDHGDYRYVVGQGQANVNQVSQIFRNAAGIVYISESNLASLQPYLPNYLGKVRKIYYGFTPEVLSGNRESREKMKISPQTIVFGMVARGIPEKGWEEAIQAFRRVEEKAILPVCLILGGDSNFLQQLKIQYSTDSIRFTGYTDQPQRLINVFDVGLLPTYFPGESLPNTIIEYLACGKPVIATDTGGIAEMIRITGTEETAGLLIPLRNGKADTDAIAEAMSAYIKMPDLLNDHSRRAAQAFRKFDPDNCFAEYESFFKEILKDKNR